MGVINVRKFGLAVALTLLFLRLGCVIVVAATSREAAVAFFNTLLHGLDVSSILRTQMSIQEMFYGLIQIFILGWLSGASIAAIYNFHFMRFDNKARPMNM